MSTKYLKRFFKPESIVLIGDICSAQDMAYVVANNIINGEYPKLFALVGRCELEAIRVERIPSLDELDWTPDLAIICRPSNEVMSTVKVLGAKQVRAAMLFSSSLYGSAELVDRDGIARVARDCGVRLLGPACIGLLVPGQKLNASYSHQNILKGKVAYIGQSSLVGAAMIDWANGQGIGFSHFITLGDGIDVDLPAVLDYLAQDPYTHSVLLQLDHMIGSARGFMSALRGVSRNKLVLVLKSEVLLDKELLELPAPGLASASLVYEAALRRAGVVRVDSSDQLFHALDTLTRMKPMMGDRLAIICNGMGPAALAANVLLRGGARLAELSDDTLALLSEKMPSGWLARNPVDLQATATPELFEEVLSIVAKDRGVDAVLVIHAPTHFAPALEAAEAVVKAAKGTRRNVLTCWMGRSSAIAARNCVNNAGIATFITPEEAVEAFLHMVDYVKNQELMRQTPPPFLTQNSPNHQQARLLVANRMAHDKNILDHADVADLLDLYDIPVALTEYARDIDELVETSRNFEGPLAIKVIYRDNLEPFYYSDRSHQRWRDLEFDLHGPEEVRQAAMKLFYRAAERHGEDQLCGFAIQEMRRGFQSLQISAGITRDPVFGPIILFGVGGLASESMADRRVMLAPLNLSLARQLVGSSRVYDIICENSEYPERDVEQLVNLLVTLSEMAVDLPHLKSLEINPLLLNRRGVLAMDATASLGEPVEPAIPPYPEDLTEEVVLRRSGRRAVVRAIRGEDEPAHLRFYQSLSPESIRLRFFYSRGTPGHQELATWTQIDYDREMAFIVSAPTEEGENETLGVVRAVADADNISAEFSVVIRDDLQGEGIGVLLMQKVIDYCRAKGTLMIEGTTLPSNKGMQGLARKLGFHNRFNAEEDVVEMKLMLHQPTEPWQVKRLEH